MLWEAVTPSPGSHSSRTAGLLPGVSRPELLPSRAATVRARSGQAMNLRSGGGARPCLRTARAASSAFGTRRGRQVSAGQRRLSLCPARPRTARRKTDEKAADSPGAAPAVPTAEPSILLVAHAGRRRLHVHAGGVTLMQHAPGVFWREDFGLHFPFR